MPKPNFLILDKELAYAEYLNIKPIIVINKIDLSEEETEKIYEIYTKTGYKVLKTEAKTGRRTRRIRRRIKK